MRLDQNGLVDEYWILTIPKLFYGGARLFTDDGSPFDLRLTEVRGTDTGAVLTRYEVT